MRFVTALLGDVRYQVKYGFYLLYAIISAFYIGILSFLPADVQQMGAALIILTDPATPGFFFIGGILLLEKGEGLHSYLAVSPLTIGEYLAAKTVSLSFISTLAGLVIALVGLRGQVQYGVLAATLMLGAAFLTLVGLGVGSLARSVNHFILISVPFGLLLMAPPVLTVFGLSHPILEPLPGTLLLRAIMSAIGISNQPSTFYSLALLTLWLPLAFWWAKRMFIKAQVFEGGAR